MKEKRAFSALDLELFTSKLPIGKTDELLMKFLSTDTIFLKQFTAKTIETWVYSPTCAVCSGNITRLEMRFRHHCRSCGLTVCGPCSRHYINIKERVCDLCFLKLLANDIKEHELMDLDNTIESLQKIVEPMKEEIEALNKKIGQENTIIQEDFAAKQGSVDRIYSEIEGLEKVCCNKSSENTLLKNELLQKNEIISKKKLDFETLRNKNIIIDTENIIKKQYMKGKVRKIELLKQDMKEKEKYLIEINKLNDYDEYAYLLKKKEILTGEALYFTPDEQNPLKCRIF